MSLKQIKNNERHDDVLRLFQPLAYRIDSEHWDVFALQSQQSKLGAGEEPNGKLTTFSLLRPTIFSGFGDVIIAGACFNDSVLHRLWTGQGIHLAPAPISIRDDLRYDSHNNGFWLRSCGPSRKTGRRPSGTRPCRWVGEP